MSRDTSSSPGLVVDPERDAGFTIHVTMVQSETAAISVVRSKSPIRIWQHAGRHTVEIARVRTTVGARGGGGEMKKKAVPTWPHAPDEAIMAIIIAWDDGLGVSYSYRNGAAEAGPIGPTDWPVIGELERDARLPLRARTCANALPRCASVRSIAEACA